MSSESMQIGEAAKRTSLTVDAIRFYERRALVPKPARTMGRFRLYTADDVARLQFIQQMQDLGFSLREIKQLLDLRGRKVEGCGSVRDLLKEKISAIRAKVQELQKLETELAAELRRCNRELEHRKIHKPCACPVLETENQKQ
jgi:DNA-binding transcriptional MerR regulator